MSAIMAAKRKAADRKAKRKAKAARLMVKQSGYTSDGQSLIVVTKPTTLSAMTNKLQRELNAAIRIRDGAVCISCGKAPLAQSDHNAGHLFGVGPFPALRFHPLNIASQCAGTCNNYRKGNHAAYAAAFIRRHGLKVFQALDAIKSEPRQWRIPDLIELRAALSCGLEAYTKRYYALTGWRTERAE